MRLTAVRWQEPTIASASINAGSAGTIAGSHVYRTSGTYTISLTMTTASGERLTVRAQVIVVVAADLPDPCHPGQSALFVGGTEADDEITVERPCQADGFKVNIAHKGGHCHGAARWQQLLHDAIDRSVVFGQAGDDGIEVAGNVRVSAWLYGDRGGDHLKGGAGNDVLLGGEGCDMLPGGAGRDVLIGGRGSDRIVGESDDDILIGAATAYDADCCALAAIAAEWARSDIGYAERVAHLEHGGGLNSPTVLNPTTVRDDGVVDKLTGSAGCDLFFVSLDCASKDIVTDAHWSEIVTDID